MVKKKRRQQRADPPYGEAGVERGRGQRRLRVGETLRHELSRVLRQGECRDPALREANVTVTEISLSPDLRNAKVFVMPLAGANAAEILAGLEHSAPFLRGRLARAAALRYAPNLVFALDRSFDHAERIAELLARPEVERDLEPRGMPAESDDDGE